MHSARRQPWQILYTEKATTTIIVMAPTESVFSTFLCHQIPEKLWPLICLYSPSPLWKMLSQAPLCQFNVLLCVSNNTLHSEHDIRPFSKSLEPTSKWHIAIHRAAFVSIKCQVEKLIYAFPTPHLQPTDYSPEICAAWLIIYWI